MSMDDNPRLSDAMEFATTPIELDRTKYASHLADFDITEAQKNELLQVLFSIMQMFVEMGFSGDICGQVFQGIETASAPESERVKLPLSDHKGGKPRRKPNVRGKKR